MTVICSAYLDAHERLAPMQEAIQIVYQHVQDRTLHKLDTPERVQLRLNRLLQNPLIEKILEAGGVVKELQHRPFDQWSETAQSELERIIEGSDFMPVWFLTRGAELRRTVARIRACTEHGEEVCGTGFLVGPRLLLTNRHVLDWTDVGKQPLEEIARHSLVEFDFEKQANGVMMDHATFRLDPATLLLTSPWNQLDYVLIAVQPKDCVRDQRPIEEYGYNRLAGDQGKINKGEPVFIIQHPEGQPKVVVVQGNRLIERGEGSPYLIYEADTDFGSSGSPVYNQQWEVVGLHHAPQIARRDGVILAKDDSPWTPDMGSAKVKYLKLNEGIRISFILKDLAAKRDAIRTGTPALASPEQCTPEGIALLEAALQFQTGVAPADLNAPLFAANPARPPIATPPAPAPARRHPFAHPD